MVRRQRPHAVSRRAVNPQTRVPAAFVKNGEIVLNVSATATRKLTIDNQWIQFTARFNGSSQEVAVPIGAVIGIFAKETGYGFSFTAPDDPVAALASSSGAARRRPGSADDGESPRKRPSHLQVVK